MNSDEIVNQVIDALEESSVPYIMVGSLSCNQYAIARSTQDADFVIQFEPGFMTNLIQRLGPPFQLDPQLQFETITGTTRSVIRVAGSDFNVEFFRQSDDPHDQARFQRRVRGSHSGHLVWVPTAEDVIIWKLRWGQNRAKDQDDVRNVISVQAARLDWDYIHAWAERHGTRGLLDKIVASIPADLLEADQSEFC